MFNCKYVENTPNTILKVINTQNSTHLLIHISKLFNPTQSVLSSGNLAQLGSRKLEVGSWKSEVGSRKTLLGFRTRRILPRLSFACAHAGYLVIFTETGK